MDAFELPVSFFHWILTEKEEILRISLAQISHPSENTKETNIIGDVILILTNFQIHYLIPCETIMERMRVKYLGNRAPTMDDTNWFYVKNNNGQQIHFLPYYTHRDLWTQHIRQVYEAQGKTVTMDTS